MVWAMLSSAMIRSIGRADWSEIRANDSAANGGALNDAPSGKVVGTHTTFRPGYSGACHQPRDQPTKR